MARRKKAKKNEEPQENVDLAGSDHSWWSASSIEPQVFDVDPPDPEPAGSAAVPEEDPYEVLRLPKDASWDDIQAAYRKLARWWHPDGLTNASATDRDACDEMIRRLNNAYGELRVRKGR